jgi:MFS family permease
MGAAPSFGFLIVMSVLLGILLVPSQSAFNTLMQMAIPIELQGRVFSSFGAITQAASVAMIALVTALVATIPLRPIFIGGGVAVVASAVLWIALVRGDVRRLEQRRREPAVPLAAGHSVVSGTD